MEAHEALVLHRREQADESLESTQLLLDKGESRPSYYAMLYTVLALLARK